MKKMSNIKVGENTREFRRMIRFAREDMGLSAAEAARRIGISGGYWAALEKGKMAGRELGLPSSGIIDNIIELFEFDGDEVYSSIGRFPSDMRDSCKKVVKVYRYYQRFNAIPSYQWDGGLNQDTNEKEFGKLLRGARKEIGMFMTEAAKRIGVSREYLSKLEFGRGKERNYGIPGINVLDSMAKILRLEKDDVYSTIGRFPSDMQSNCKEVIQVYRAYQRQGP